MSAVIDWQPPIITSESHDVSSDVAGFTKLIESEIDLHEMLTEHRGLAFRGFDVTRDSLDRVIDLLLPNRLSYLHGSTPRTNLGDNIYTSTEYPADQSISLHSELCYAHRWPSRLLFFCATPAATGGATSVAHAGRWLRELDATVRDAFADGIRYTQNLHDGMGLGRSWQQSFETDDRAKVEEFLAQSSAEWEWNDDGLRVTQIRPSTTHHPETGEEVWFNQVDQWHPAGLPEDIRALMLDMVPEDQLPQAVYFADGSPIPDEYVQHVKDTGWKLAYDMNWQAGDLLLIDNVLTAHARRPYTGTRQVLVSMSG